jgi:tetratricopeptide (TPR) repeat protein
VEGRVFHRSAVQTLGSESTSLQQRLLTLVRKQLVRPDRAQLRNDEAYRFRHLLIRDAAYEALPKSVRADLHERFARWLEERGADLVELDEIVGYHLEQAARYRQELGQPDTGVAERAGERLAVAGRQALWRGDKQAATGLLARALVLLRPIRWDTYLELDLLDSLDLHARDAMAREEEIARRAQMAGDVRGEAVARILVASREYSHGAGGSVDDIEALALATLPLLEEAEDHRGLIRVWSTLGFAVSNPRQHYEGWGQAAEQAIPHARAIGQPGLFELPQALVHGPRPADEALQRLESLMQDEPHPYSAMWHAVLLAMLGRIDEAQVEANAAFHRWQELNISAIAFWLLALVDLLAGDHEAAADHLRTLCDRLAAMGRFAELSTFGPWLGRVLCDLGRYEEAEPLAKQGRELGIEDDIITQALWRQVQARVLAHRGEHVGAERLAREAVALMESSDSLNWQGDALCDLAEVLQRAGRAQEAAALLEEALERYGAKRNLAMVAHLRQRMTATRAVR